jgi:Txe/YoeB family toxin of Txe-Axe toxin-antitoxin module
MSNGKVRIKNVKIINKLMSNIKHSPFEGIGNFIILGV